MGVKYEVTAVMREDGREKGRYVKLGVVLDTKRGPMIKIENIPVGWDGWAYLNEPREARQDSPKSESRKSNQLDDDGDDIPF